MRKPHFFDVSCHAQCASLVSSRFRVTRNAQASFPRDLVLRAMRTSHFIRISCCAQYANLVSFRNCILQHHARNTPYNSIIMRKDFIKLNEKKRVPSLQLYLVYNCLSRFFSSGRGWLFGICPKGIPSVQCTEIYCTRISVCLSHGYAERKGMLICKSKFNVL